MAIGYACVTVGGDNTSFSHCILKNATEDNLRRIIDSNLTTLDSIIHYNIKNNIKLFRISSDIIPFGSHPINQIKWWEEYGDRLKQIGLTVKESKMRVSMHPGQYTVLNSPDERIVLNAVADLQYHSRLLNALGMGRECKLVLHIGGVYNDKEKAAKTFIQNFYRLPQDIKERLILENDEKSYNICDVLAIANETGSPVVFDNLHHKINPPDCIKPDEEWIEECSKTWKTNDGKQKIHYSDQKEGGQPGSHSDTIAIKEFKEFYNKLPDKDISIMLEVKDKNLSAIKCNYIIRDATAKQLEVEWARYKYYVLSKSANIYNKIRRLLKDKDAHVAMEFYGLIESSMDLKEDTGAQVNAAQHVWGYISKDCTSSTKNRYEKLLKEYKMGGKILPLKNHLLKCAKVRNLDYLIYSLYFYLNI